MERKRKNFIKGAAIGNLVQAGIYVVLVIMLFALINSITNDFIINLLKQIGFVEVDDVLTRIGENGDTVSLTSKNVEMLTIFLKNFIIQTAFSLLVVAVLNIIFNIIALVQVKQGSSKIWALIVCLITSILAGNFVCMTLFIVALCLRTNKAI